MLRAHLKAEIDKWGPIIKKAGPTLTDRRAASRLKYLRRAFVISRGDPWILVLRPISAILFLLAALAMVAPAARLSDCRAAPTSPGRSGPPGRHGLSSRPSGRA